MCGYPSPRAYCYSHWGVKSGKKHGRKTVMSAALGVQGTLWSSELTLLVNSSYILYLLYVNKIDDEIDDETDNMMDYNDRR